MNETLEYMAISAAIALALALTEALRRCTKKYLQSRDASAPGGPPQSACDAEEKLSGGSTSAECSPEKPKSRVCTRLRWREEVQGVADRE